MLLNNKWITEEIKEQIKKYKVINENENTMIQNQWDAVKVVLNEVYSDKSFPKETRQTSNK